MTIAAVGTLFPAIPLAIVALNFRYTSLAGLMRNISSQMEVPKIDQSRQTILNKELSVVRKWCCQRVGLRYFDAPLPMEMH